MLGLSSLAVFLLPLLATAMPKPAAEVDEPELSAGQGNICCTFKTNSAYTGGNPDITLHDTLPGICERNYQGTYYGARQDPTSKIWTANCEGVINPPRNNKATPVTGIDVTCVVNTRSCE